MNLPALKKITLLSTVDAVNLGRQLMAFVSYVADAMNPLLARPRAFSTVQTVEFVNLTPKKVAHKLPLKPGQTPAGWLITDTDTGIRARRVSWDDKFIEIETTDDCTVSLEVW